MASNRSRFNTGITSILDKEDAWSGIVPSRKETLEGTGLSPVIPTFEVPEFQGTQISGFKPSPLGNDFTTMDNGFSTTNPTNPGNLGDLDIYINIKGIHPQRSFRLLIFLLLLVLYL